MSNSRMVWELEMVPDLDGYARANNLTGRSADEVRSAMDADFLFDYLHRRSDGDAHR